MKIRIIIAAMFVVLSAGSICTTLAEDAIGGTLSRDRYENPNYGFNILIPAGWKLAGPDLIAEVQKAVPDPGRIAVLLVLQPDNPASGTVIALESEKFRGVPRFSSEIGRAYVEGAARIPNVSVVLSPRVVMLDGVDFYRCDVKGGANGPEHYISVVALGVKDRVIAFNVHGDSQKDVDDAVYMLVNAVHFKPDWSVPDSELDNSAKRVRVSMGVAEGLNRRKVRPNYPDEARLNHVQGTVILSALISRTGAVQRLWVLEGDPSLADSAVKAVQQWQYKPYVLNGEPVKLETKIAVNFELR